MANGTPGAPGSETLGDAPNFDRLTREWYVDKLVQVLVFIGGISAIIFIIGIFVFISREGLGFLFEGFSFTEFFFSPNWRPTSESRASVAACPAAIRS